MIKAALDTEIVVADAADELAADANEGAVDAGDSIGVEEILVEEVSIDGMCGVY